MENGKLIRVEVAYATPQEQIILGVDVEEGATVLQAIEQSSVLSKFSDIDMQENKVGIWGKLCTLDTQLAEHDRIEIYRKLIADPKQARKNRAKRQADGS